MGQEMELLKKLQHPNIVRYVDCAVRAEEGKTGPPHHVVLHILLEYMENGASLSLSLDRSIGQSVSGCPSGCLQVQYK